MQGCSHRSSTLNSRLRAGWEYSNKDDFQDVVCRVDNVELITTDTGQVEKIGVTYVFRRFVDCRPCVGMTMPHPARRWREIAAGFVLDAGMMLLVGAIALGLGWFRGFATRRRRGPKTR